MFGQFVAIEGLECSGKSSVVQLLNKKLPKGWLSVNEVAGKVIQKGHDLNPYCDPSVEPILSKAYVDQMELLIPKLESGINILTDRSWLSQDVYLQARKKFNTKYKNFNIENVDVTIRDRWNEVWKKIVVFYIQEEKTRLLMRQEKYHNLDRDALDMWIQIVKEEYNRAIEDWRQIGRKVIIIQGISIEEKSTSILKYIL